MESRQREKGNVVDNIGDVFLKHVGKTVVYRNTFDLVDLLRRIAYNATQLIAVINLTPRNFCKRKEKMTNGLRSF
jgi:hypothetical protein